MVILHAGSGVPDPERKRLHPRYRGPEWEEICVDLDPNVKPDIVANITDLSPIADESVDVAWCYHVLEHMHAHEVPVALSELRRVLVKDGKLEVSVPDLQAVGEMLAAGDLEERIYMAPVGPVSPIDMIYGLRPAIELGGDLMTHKTGFVDRTLCEAITHAGFRVECRRELFQLIAEAWRQ